jgi:hyperosmotically inducible periplasmic protein
MKSIHPVLLLTACCAMLLAACNQAVNPIPAQSLAASAAAHGSDADVTTRVISALNNDPRLAGLDMAVITTKGDVRLTGVVSSQAQIDVALNTVRAVEGAHTIHNELTVKP